MWWPPYRCGSCPLGLHLDKDFDAIADITGQPIERLRTH